MFEVCDAGYLVCLIISNAGCKFLCSTCYADIFLCVIVVLVLRLKCVVFSDVIYFLCVVFVIRNVDCV